ncbi:MAG: glycosyltransferase [Phenylobacterium sp.]|uniref:glycosyltransferase family 4 protein n=1 Tax=Phenylobacterium sp. TaxID=1871053 RepID=UPI0025D68126|nr:glycosyltransferase family 1 protein [Phenylobacterium sp.]MBI1199814.1 glycosyltransferase [Phenylobacterium sp.]
MNACTFNENGRAAGLRLALFSGNYNYTRDGANQALNRLVAYLVSEGAAVRVYSPTTDTPAFEPAGDLVSVPSMPIPGRGEYRVALPLPRRLRQDILDFAPTAIHLSAPDLLGVQARRMGARLGAPVVASLHTRFETYLSYYGFGWLRPAAERYLAGFYGGCDCVLAPNNPIAELVKAQAPKTKVSIWSRGVDRSRFSPARRDPAWRREMGLGDKDVAVMFLGRLVQEKGLDIFVRTFERLAARPNIRPMVVGDGPAGAWLRSRLPQGVFTGFLTDAALGRAVASADIMFNPSQTEAFGNATLEAMAAGLAVVCPDVPSTRELVTPDVDGVLTGSRDAAGFAEAIGRLADHPAVLARLGAAARKTSGRYDWAASCATVLDVYEALGGTSRAARPFDGQAQRRAAYG